MSDKNKHGKSVDSLLGEIDDVMPVGEVGKRARLSDVNGSIVKIQGELVGLRRMLMQHRAPEAYIQEGLTLGAAIRDTTAQYKRLLAYREELEALPDDPEAQPEEAHTDE